MGRNETTIREREKVEWEIPRNVLEDLREYCRTHDARECEAACLAIRRYLSERLLEEGE
jgi:hypothetical protein